MEKNNILYDKNYASSICIAKLSQYLSKEQIISLLVSIAKTLKNKGIIK